MPIWTRHPALVNKAGSNIPPKVVDGRIDPELLIFDPKTCLQGGPYRLSVWKMNKINKKIIFIAYRFGDKDKKINIVLYRFVLVS